MAPIATFSGLASGIQWQDMVEQIMNLEKGRQLFPVQRQATLQQSRIDAWNRYSGLVSSLGTAAKAWKGGTALDVFSTSVGASATSGRTLFSASASSTAAPGTYKVEVESLARSEKVGGDFVSSATTALGVTGSFLLNGRQVGLDGTETLSGVRDKINSLNSGTNPTRVTASILSTSSGTHQLVLTSDTSGTDGIEMANVTGTAVESLGLARTGTLAANRTADGLTQTFRLNSDTAALTTVLGISPPPANTSVMVGGKRIDVDFSTDTLQSVVAKINAAGGFAAIRQETVSGTTAYRLVTSGEVSADSAPSFGSTAADSQRAIELLGFQVGSRDAIRQTLTSGNALSDVASGGTATSAAKLTDLRDANGGSLLDGETITLRGTRADGTAAELSFTVNAADAAKDDLSDLLSAIGQTFGTASRTATASVDASGKIVVTDDQAGGSQLSLSISTGTRAGVLDFGGMSTTQTGRLREVVSGSNAQVRVDGVLISRQSNTITDAIAGVTLNLQQAEDGTEVDLTVSRDQDAMVADVKKFVDAYNKTRDFVRQQNSGPRNPLDGNTSLRTTVRSMTNVLLTEVTDPASTMYDRLTLVGVSLNRDGVLEIDETKLRESLGTNLTDVKTLLSDVGTRMSAVTEALTRSGDGTIAGTTGALDRMKSRLQERTHAVEDRLEQRRTAMIKQFAQMEKAIGQIQAQGNWLAGQIQALPTYNRP